MRRNCPGGRRCVCPEPAHGVVVGVLNEEKTEGVQRRGGAQKAGGKNIKLERDGGKSSSLFAENLRANDVRLGALWEPPPNLFSLSVLQRQIDHTIEHTN